MTQIAAYMKEYLNLGNETFKAPDRQLSKPRWFFSYLLLSHSEDWETSILALVCISSLAIRTELN